MPVWDVYEREEEEKEKEGEEGRKKKWMGRRTKIGKVENSLSLYGSTVFVFFLM